MSMISGLIDELNKSADEWNGSNMFELARMCRNAADIIWQLRDDLQRANTDNAKLREQVDAAHMSRLLTENENESLRDLVHVLLQCRVEGDDICAKCNYRSPLHGGCMADVKADELGVEVD